MTSFKKLLSWGIIAIIVLAFISSAWFIIQPGEKGLLIRLGSISETTYDNGFHFKIPFLDRIERISIQTQKLQGEGNAASKDLQSVQGDIVLNYRIDPSQIITIYKAIWGNEAVENKIIWPMIQEWVKATTAKYTAEELITKRQLVSMDMSDTMKKKLSVYGIIVQDVNIVNFSFSDGFDRAIENKVKAEQDALAQKNTLEKIKYEAQQKIETAKAEAESIRIQVEAIKSQWGGEYINLKWIEKWDGKLPQTQLGGNTPLIMNMKN